MIRNLVLLAGGLWLGRKFLRDKAAGENATDSLDADLKHRGYGKTRAAPTDALSAAPPDPATGHVPRDLLSDAHPDGNARADDHFRPEPTAPVAPEDRESLRPVTAPAPHDPPGRPDT